MFALWCVFGFVVKYHMAVGIAYQLVSVFLPLLFSCAEYKKMFQCCANIALVKIYLYIFGLW